MNIRAKLVLLVLGMIILISCASSVYFILQAPLLQIDKERKYLDNLVIATMGLQTEINKLDSSTFVVERLKFYVARVKFGEAFKYIQQITYLRKSDKTLANALDIVERLQKLNDENLLKVIELYDEVYKDAETLFIFPDSSTPNRIYNDSTIVNRNSEAKTIALFNLSRFNSAISILNDSLESSINVILEQEAVIDNEIKQIQRQSVTVALSVIAALLVIIALGALIFANTIAKSVIQIAQGV